MPFTNPQQRINRLRKDYKGGMSFIRHLRFPEGVYIHKTAALLVYFERRRQAMGTDDERVITFEYLACPTEDEFEQILSQRGDARLAGDVTNGRQCTLHADVMEAVTPADAFVNFANENFGYGCFIPSCTQEEILQLCCPEFNVGMLLLGKMGDGEVVNVTGCRRYSRYSGPLDASLQAAPKVPEGPLPGARGVKFGDGRGDGAGGLRKLKTYATAVNTGNAWFDACAGFFSSGQRPLQHRVILLE